MPKLLGRQAATQRNRVLPVRRRQHIARDPVFASVDHRRQTCPQQSPLTSVEPAFEDALLGAPGKRLQNAHHTPPPTRMGDIEADDSELTNAVHQATQ